jgi:hypothetical protein
MARSGRNKVIAQSMNSGAPVDTYSGMQDFYGRSVKILKNRRKKKPIKTKTPDEKSFY